eukprot:4597092-Prymnesium_polylepis.1
MAVARPCDRCRHSSVLADRLVHSRAQADGAAAATAAAANTVGRGAAAVLHPVELLLVWNAAARHVQAGTRDGMAWADLSQQNTAVRLYPICGVCA